MDSLTAWVAFSAFVFGSEACLGFAPLSAAFACVDACCWMVAVMVEMAVAVEDAFQQKRIEAFHRWLGEVRSPQKILQRNVLKEAESDFECFFLDHSASHAAGEQ